MDWASAMFGWGEAFSAEEEGVPSFLGAFVVVVVVVVALVVVSFSSMSIAGAMLVVWG